MNDLEVVVFEAGPYISYAACGMPFMISETIQDPHSLVIVDPQKAREKRGLDVRPEHRVVGLDAKKKVVSYKQRGSAEVRSLPYKRLVLATGARATVPPVPGVQLQGVFLLRNFEQGLALKHHLKAERPKSVVIVGSGLVGLEMADAFRSKGLQVTLLKSSASPLLDLDPRLSEVVEEELARNECVLLKSSPLEAIEDNGQGEVARVLAGGETLETPMVLIATGVRPETTLAEEAGLSLGAKGALAVDEHLVSSDESIYGAGDCTEQVHRVSREKVFVSQAQAANRQGRIAGANVAASLKGQPASMAHPGTMGTVLTTVFDLEVALTGLSVKAAAAAGFEPRFTLITDHSRAGYFPGAQPIHVGLVYEAMTGRLLGAQMVGREGVAKRIDIISTAMDAGMDLQRLSDLDLSYCPPAAPPWDPVLIAANVASKQLKKK